MAETVDIATIKTQAAALLEAGVSYGLSLATAIALLIAGITVSGWASRAVRRKLEAIEKFDQTLVPILAQIVRYSILILTAILVLAEFGVQTASIIAVLGTAGLAIGLALQGTLQNVAAGLMLLILRPFRVGDSVRVAGESGTVDEIGLFMTRLHTPDNIFIAVPNAKIFSSTITNFTMRPRRRIDIVVSISYDDDIDQAMAVLQQVMEREERLLKRPPPAVFVRALAESSVDLEMRAWARKTQFWDVKRDLMRAVKYALDEAGVTIPYPHRQVILSPGPSGDEPRVPAAPSA